MTDGHRTLDLNEAAEFLHVSPAVTRQKACVDMVRRTKPRKCWGYLENELADHLHSLHPNREEASERSTEHELTPCHSSNMATTGGRDSNYRGQWYASLWSRRQEKVIIQLLERAAYNTSRGTSGFWGYSLASSFVTKSLGRASPITTRL